jgi:transposase
MANRQVKRRFSEDEMNRGIGKLEAGRSQRHVAHFLGVSQSVVSIMWNRFKMTGNVLQGQGGGRKRSTTLNEYLTTFRIQLVCV